MKTKCESCGANVEKYQQCIVCGVWYGYPSNITFASIEAIACSGVSINNPYDYILDNADPYLDKDWL